MAYEMEIARGRRSGDRRLGIPIQAQNVFSRYVPNPSLQVIQMVKVIETKILVDDVLPIIVLKLFNRMLA